MMPFSVSKIAGTPSSFMWVSHLEATAASDEEERGIPFVVRNQGFRPQLSSETDAKVALVFPLTLSPQHECLLLKIFTFWVSKNTSEKPKGST